MKEKQAVTRGFEDMWKVWTDREKELATKMLGSQKKAYKQNILEHPDELPGLAFSWNEEIQRGIDAAISGSEADISCRKGCAHCCYLDVAISHEEALMLEELTKQGLNIDTDRLTKQALTKDWETLDYKDRKCVFLDTDNSCSIHEFRPGSCRNHLVVSPAEDCDTLNHGGERVQYIAMTQADIAIMAAWNSGESGRLATKLLNLLK
jgi:Fe-S-cluster containining protein